ncbi:fungal-specific transcription factor domain-containing protein [Xylariaceae sp. FL0662B]|nr:fungal-specific transcription factor domain-containing protein [Xylariaceae sp. FL0662B]
MHPDPSCSACLSKNEKCEIRNGEDRCSSRQTHESKELRQRIAALEEMVRKSTPFPSPSNSGSPSPQITAVTTAGADANANHFSSRPIRSSSFSQQSQPSYREMSGSASSPGDATPRSTSTRTGLTKKQLNQELRSVGLFPYSERYIDAPTITSEDEASQRARVALESSPEPEPIISHLLELFWGWQASYLLVVDRGIFTRSRKVWDESGGHGDRNFYTPCLLYSILSLASMISPDRGVRRYSAPSGGPPGELFCKRARALFELEMERPTVTTVQAALILGSRYGAMVDNSLGWIYSGIVFRISSKLGLHLDCSRVVALEYMSPELAEVRAMTFWGCFIEDNLFSAYCNRPTFFKERDITAQLPQKPLLRTTGALSLLFSKTLVGLYSHRCDSTSNQLGALASQINRDLWKWHQELPNELVWSANEMAYISSQVFVLHMHFYFALNLLHRRFLRFSQAPHDINNLVESAQNPTVTCAIAAVNITKLACNFQQHHNIEQVPAPIVHTLFIAGSIHLVNHCLTKLESYHILLETSLTALLRMSNTYPMAHKAASTLQEWIDNWKSSSDMEEAVNVPIASEEADRGFVKGEQYIHNSGEARVSALPGMDGLLGAGADDEASLDSYFVTPNDMTASGQWMPDQSAHDAFEGGSGWPTEQTWLESIYGNAFAINNI